MPRLVQPALAHAALPAYATHAALMALLALAACNPPGAADTAATPTTPPTPSSTSRDAWLIDAITSLGERAAFVAVMRPDRWSSLHADLTPAGLSELASNPDPNLWLAVILDELGPEDPPDAPERELAPIDWTAWDRTRPLVIAIGDVALDGPTGTLVASFPLTHHPGMRHEVVFPATDPAALTAALARDLAPLGEARPGFITRFPGAHAWALGTRDTLAVIPGDRLVRVILDVGAVAPDGVATLPDLSPRPAARTTAGVLALAAGDDAALLIRPHRLPAFTTAMAVRETPEILALVPRGWHALAARQMLRSQAACELVWGAEPLEFDDYVVGLTADERSVYLRAVASTTPRGDAAIEAGLRGAGSPLALVRPAALDAWIRLDTTAATATTGAPVSALTDEVLDAGPECDPMVSMIRKYGPPAPFGPFSPTAPFAGVARHRADTPPSARTLVGQLAITDPAARQGGVAWLTDASLGDRTLEAPLREWGASLGSEVHLVNAPEGDRQRVRAGYNLLPADVFGGAAPHDGLAHVRADLPALIPLLATWALPLVDFATTYDRLTGSLRRDGRVLVAELALTIGDPTPRPLRLTATWDPLPPVVQPRCAQDYARGLVALLTPFTGTDETADIDTALASLAALRPALDCLAADPTVDARRLYAVAAENLAEGLLEQFRRGDAIRVLTTACDAGVTAACTRIQQLATTTTPLVPLVDPICETMNPPSSTLVLTSAGRTLDGVPLADDAALRSALTDAPGLTLAIDHTMTLAELRPTFIILSELPASPRLTFLARIKAAAAPKHYALAPPRLGPNSAALPASRDTTTILLTGDTPRQPGDVAGPVFGPLRVVVDDTSTWQAIASALARSCDGATLVPKSAPRRPAPPDRPPAR